MEGLEVASKQEGSCVQVGQKKLLALLMSGHTTAAATWILAVSELIRESIDLLHL